jgi:hypothetical protein
MTEDDEKSWIQDIAKTRQNEGVLKAAWSVLQDVTSLGGNYRIRFVKEQIQGESREYESILGQINLDESLIRAHIDDIGIQLNAACTMLDKAHDLLSPLGQQTKAKVGFSPRGTDLAYRATNLKLERFTADYQSFLRTATGAGAGTTTAAGLWGAVQVLGHASTGAAMAGLHGAAATSAGWAWFGGGSLAAGGGGMALGHFVLPGIGTAVAVSVSAVLSHRKANEQAKLLQTLIVANQENARISKTISEMEQKYAEGERKLEKEVSTLQLAAAHATRRLRRFGFLSHIFKLIRYRLFDYYYTSAEMEEANTLEEAVERFIAAFKRKE